MIDFANEQVLSITDATKILPRRRMGRKPHIATLYRWSERGVKGVVLETIHVGGTRCTSVEALQRFFDRLTKGPSAPPPPVLTSRAWQRKMAKMDRELDAMGL